MSIQYKNNISPNPDFSAEEERVLKFWEKENGAKENIFEQSLESTKDNDQFVFYDGPPFANGLPHYGHLLTSCVKDTVGRFQTMCGKNVARRFGWDCHGLPAEMAAEKELKVSGRKAIEDFGIAKFNDHCKKDVMKYSGEWKRYIDRIGRWADMENAYKTMDVSFMESIFWAFKTLYDKGLVYEEMRVMPYSWACQTPLSNFETRLDNSYRQKESKSLIVKFLLHFPPESIKNLCKKAYLLVWTTTPWTLPSNLAIAVNKDLDYEYIVKDDIAYISANLKNYLKDLGVSENVEDTKSFTLLSLQGSELVGIYYQPLFDYFINKASKNSFQIYQGDFVTAIDGTGVVHIAPGFGEDDFDLCKRNNIGVRVYEEDNIKFRLMPAVPVDDSGKFTSDVPDFQGMHVFDANDEVIKALKIKGNWVKTDQYLHQYPHCWRTDTPIIYKAMPSFYIRVAQARDRLCELNQEINWIPENIKDGLFGNWLKEARDWSISRNRFFGTPIPVWKSNDSRYSCIKVFGSIEELENFFGDHYSKTHGGQKLEVKDLHRQFIDELVAPNPNDPTGKSMLVRITDVFDCWFESGSMSFAEVHYPFDRVSYDGVINNIVIPVKAGTQEKPQDNENFDELEDTLSLENDNKKKIVNTKLDSSLLWNDNSKYHHIKDYKDSHFSPESCPPKRLPADFIVEYTAQTRGWFYTLMVLSTLIFDKIPFKNCICHGVILDERGQKLSKRLQNYIDPIDAMNEYGADALRYVMLSSNVMNGGELLIDKDGKMLQEAIRLTHKPIWSALNFFILYAKEDKPEIKLIKLDDINKDFTLSSSVVGKDDDCFIIMRAHALHFKIFEALNAYRVADAYKEVRDFIDDLNNCYIRWNRDRFWGSEMGPSKSNAYNSLYTALYYLSISIGPLLPFLSEILFQTIQNDDKKSVHLEKYSFDELYNSYFGESDLKTDNTNKKDYYLIVNLFHCLKAIDHHVGSLRDDKLQIRRRQPLKTITIFSNKDFVCFDSEDSNKFLFTNKIQEICNCKEVVIEYISEDNYQNYSGFFTRSLKLNTRALGKKYGSKLRDMQTALNKNEYKSLSDECIEIAGLKLEKDEFFWDVQIDSKYQNNASIALSEGSDFMIVMLDSELNDELVAEGMVRDVIRAIQDARKKHLHISDRIELHLWSEEQKVIDACRKYAEEIASETLVKSVEDLNIYDAFKDFYCDEIKILEEKIVNNDMAIFGYQVEDALLKKHYDLKLSYRKI
jgi:isoleucyl-tRNA synthetase